MKLISVTTLAIVLLLLPSPNQAMALPPELQTLMDFKTGSGLGSILEAKDKFIKSLSKPRHKRTAIPPSTKRDPVPSLGEDFGFFPHQGEDIVPDLGVDEKKREKRREEAARRRMKEKYSYEEMCERDREWGQKRFYRKN